MLGSTRNDEGPNGVRVYDTSSWRLQGQDGKYENGAQAYAVDFGRPNGGAGRLYTGDYEGRVRLYEVSKGAGKDSLMKVSESRVPRDRADQVNNSARSIVSLKISPGGKLIALGFRDSATVVILNATDLTLVREIQAEGVKGNLARIAWSADGKKLIAAGAGISSGKVVLKSWDTANWRPLNSLGLASNTVMDLVALPQSGKGGWMFVTAEPVWGLIDDGINIKERVAAPIVSFIGSRGGLRVDHSGANVAFKYTPQDGLSSFSVSALRIGLAAADDLARPVFPEVTASGVEVFPCDGSNLTTINARPIELEAWDGCRSYSVAPGGRHVLIGSEWNLRLFDLGGEEVWRLPLTGTAWSVSISADGKWAVAACGDGTIRWARMGSSQNEYRDGGQEVLAFLPHANRQDWVLWTPEGFYAGSPGAEGLIGYHLNRGKDHEAEFIGAAQLRGHFYNPVLVSARLGQDGDRLMAAAVAKLGDVQTLLANARNVPPVIELLSPEQVEGESEVTLTFRVQDRGGGIGALKFYVDEQPVEGRQSGVSAGQTMTRTFALAPGRRQIAVAADSRGGVESLHKQVVAKLSGPKQAGTLHILAVGVEAYQDRTLELKNSVRDAEKVAEELAQRGKPLFAQVATPRVLKNEQATLAGIRTAFTEMQKRMNPDVDTLVIFLAGHGQADVGKYSFLPWDYRKGADGAGGEGLNEARLFDMLDRSPAKTLLLIDSCEAGGMVEWLEGAYERIGALKKRAVIGAARRGELAREGFEGHGVFSAAVLRALRQSANGRPLTVPRLYSEISDGVDEISSLMKGGYSQRVKGFLGSADFPLVRR